VRIYTEVNYIWKDDKLIQTDSKSYEYEGEIESCHWYHRHSPVVAPKVTIPKVLQNVTIPKITIPKITIPSVPDIIKKYKGSDIDKGLTSGQTAITNTLTKINKDNPNPNLNVQTPGQLFDKGKQVLHDAATNISGFIDKNTDTISQYGDAATDDLLNQITTIASDLVDPDGDGGGGSGLLEDSEPGTRRTASGRKYGASGRSTSGRRGIEQKKGLASSLITKYKQKRL
jgi:hypothetical protein